MHLTITARVNSWGYSHEKGNKGWLEGVWKMKKCRRNIKKVKKNVCKLPSFKMYFVLV